MTKIIALLVLILIFQSNSFEQSKRDAELKTTLDQLILKRLPSVAPGCVVLIAKKGKVIYQKAFGFANLEQNVPMSTDMIFRIGSITKQFTAIAILQLVQQGKIYLQDSLQQYVPDYPYNGNRITIENLLTQTSGIKDYMEILSPVTELTNYTPKQGVNYFKNEPLEFKPGSQFKYSNSNYYLLGYILELVTRKSYANYLREYIFDKARLLYTSYINTNKIVAKVAQGYSRFDGKLERATLQNITTIYSAGGLMSNAEDLFKWHQALYNKELIDKKLLNKAFTPFRFLDSTYSQYGYGWFLKNLDGTKTLEHGGSTDGYQSDVIYLPEEDVFVVTLFNCFEADMDWMMLSNDIAKLAIGKSLNAEVHLSNEILQKYVGVYVFNAEHTLIVTLEDGNLFVQDTNPNDRLPKVQLHAKTEGMFYIKEAELKFEFMKDSGSNFPKIVTYNNHGKDADWIRKK